MHELGLHFVARPLAGLLPRGDGHPVLVLPGLLADDRSTGPLRAVLRRLGYDVHGWNLGRNIGPTAQSLGGMRKYLGELHQVSGRPVSLIGWSLGGIFARELARESPDSVRQVITLGSPFRMARRSQSRAHQTFERYSHLHAVQSTFPLERDSRPLPMPATSIYSRFDGIVNWRTCIDRTGSRAENIAVITSHVGIGHHPSAMYAVADRLAQPEDAWTPFRAPALLCSAFPRPDEPEAEQFPAAAA